MRLEMRLKRCVTAFAFALFCVVLLIPKEARAATGTLTGGSFNYDEATGTLTITGNGEIDDETGVLKKLGAKHVIIQKGVTAIGNYTFKDWDALESVSLPDSLTKIGYHAFRGCEKLTNITIPATVTETASNIGGFCFLKSGLQTITFADGATIIPHSLCAGAEKLTTVNLPKTIKSIETEAFSGCSALQKVILPDGLTLIGYQAFKHCENLTSITIPATVTKRPNVGSYCFLGSGLQTITFADSATIIPHSLCAGAEKLTTVNLPKTIKSIEDYAFSGCISLENITIYDQVTTISKYDVFKDCNKLVIKGYTGSYAQQYAQQNNIKFISIGYVPPKKGDTVKNADLTYKITNADTDGKGTVTVYKLNKNKKSITIPKNIMVKGYAYQVTGIASKAFYKKNKVKTISIKSTTIKSIGKNAFKGINKKAVFKVPKNKYNNYKKMLTSKTGFVKNTMKIKK